MIPIVVKHGSESVDMGLYAPESFVSHLHSDLESRICIFARHQKLIFKGKVLDPSSRLKDALSIPAPSTSCPPDRQHPVVKLMLLVSQQGGGAPPTKVSQQQGA
jgi:hypothetical protein